MKYSRIAIEALIPVALWLIQDVLTPLAAITFSVFIGALELVIGLLARFTDWAVANPGIIQGVTLAVLGLYTAFKTLKFITGLIALVGNWRLFSSR